MVLGKPILPAKDTNSNLRNKCIDTDTTREKSSFGEKKNFQLSSPETYVFCKQLLNENNTFLSFDELNQKVNINSPFTLYYGLITSIPTEWKKLLRNQNNCSQTVISTLVPPLRAPINTNRLLFSSKQSNKSFYIREQNLKLCFHQRKYSQSVYTTFLDNQRF